MKKDSIYQLTAHYDDKHQGKSPRVLYVCNAGMHRSATAARLAGEYGINSRACGTAGYALIPLSANLIEWAESIVFMKESNREMAKLIFDQYPRYLSKISNNSEVWDIEDDYEYMDSELVRLIRHKLEN